MFPPHELLASEIYIFYFITFLDIPNMFLC